MKEKLHNCFHGNFQYLIGLTAGPQRAPRKLLETATVVFNYRQIAPKYNTDTSTKAKKYVSKYKTYIVPKSTKNF